MIPPRPPGEHEVVIEAHGLTQRFGSFTAVDHVSFRIERGEIFGFLGANGCGKSTTMKMLCGLLPPTEGQAWLFGEPVDANDIAVRRKVGYMSQAFSLYSELTVRQNLVLHAQLFDVPKGEIPRRVEETAARFGLDEIMDALPDSLPLGQRQRLQLAVALIHRPDLLILDEPTSGVDPVARDGFWEHLIELSRRDKVTIFVSTHFINEAGRCDRISLMSAGKVLVIDTPDGVVKGRHAATLEDAFIGYLEEAEAKGRAAEPAPAAASRAGRGGRGQRSPTPARAGLSSRFSLQRMLSCSYRELLELTRDPIRLTMAGLGSVILMIIMGYGITLDVEHLNYAVLDRDQTTVSRDYRSTSPARAGTSPSGRRSPTTRNSTGACGRERSAWSSRSPPASAATWSAGGRSTASRCGSASGSTAPCRSAPRRSGATCRACTSSGSRTSPGIGSVSAWTTSRHDRAALPLQPRRQEPGGDGAGGDPAPAAA